MLVLLLGLLYATTPNLKVTPGVVNPKVTQAISCTTKWGKDRRHVTETMKRNVAKAYHVPWAQRARFEFDHLISRELGGADDERNLWPQPKFGARTAGQKDVLENKLHRMVCSGELTLGAAQEAIRADWWSAYQRFVQ